MKKLTTTQKGKIAELKALVYLQNKGYLLLQQNYRFGKGEIDLIMQQGNEIIFVEVKSLSNTTFGLPETAVTDKKQSLLQTTAEHFLQTHNLNNPIRFDIVSIINEAIEHFEDAF